MTYHLSKKRKEQVLPLLRYIRDTHVSFDYPHINPTHLISILRSVLKLDPEFQHLRGKFIIKKQPGYVQFKLVEDKTSPEVEGATAQDFLSTVNLIIQEAPSNLQIELSLMSQDEIERLLKLITSKGYTYSYHYSRLLIKK